MSRFLKFLNEESRRAYYSIRIDPTVTSRQLLINKLNEMDNSLLIDNKYSASMVWVETNLSKEEIESITGVNYVQESEEKI